MFWSVIHDKKSYEPQRQYRWYVTFFDREFTFALKEIQKPEYAISFTEHKLLTHTYKLPGLLKWKPINIKFISTVGEKNSLPFALETVLRQYGYVAPVDYSFVTSTETEKATAYSQKELEEIKKSLETSFKDASGAQQKKEFGKDIKQKEIPFIYQKINRTTINGRHQQVNMMGDYNSNDFSGRLLNNQGDDANFKKLEITQIDQNGIVIERWELYNCFFSSVKYGSLSYENENFVEVSVTLEYDWAVQYDEYQNAAAKAAAFAAIKTKLDQERARIQTEIDNAKKLKKESDDYEKLRALEAKEADLQRLRDTGTDAEKAAAEAKLEELETLRKEQKEKEKQFAEEARQAEEDRQDRAEQQREDAEELKKNAQEQEIERLKAEEERAARAKVDGLVNDEIDRQEANSDTAAGNEQAIREAAAEEERKQVEFFQGGRTNEQEIEKNQREADAALQQADTRRDSAQAELDRRRQEEAQDDRDARADRHGQGPEPSDSEMRARDAERAAEREAQRAETQRKATEAQTAREKEQERLAREAQTRAEQARVRAKAEEDRRAALERETQTQSRR